MNFGEPEDVDGECNAHLYIADNFGDNHATMRCGLPKGHTGHHSESFERDGAGACIHWERDERSSEDSDASLEPKVERLTKEK